MRPGEVADAPNIFAIPFGSTSGAETSALSGEWQTEVMNYGAKGPGKG